MSEMEDWMEENLTSLEDDFDDAAQAVSLSELDYISDKSANPDFAIPKEEPESPSND